MTDLLLVFILVAIGCWGMVIEGKLSAILDELKKK